MSVATDQIEREIDKLPVEEMMSMHERLIATIYAKIEAEGLDPAFRAEIIRRLSEIETGTAKGVDAFQALRGM